MQCLANENTTVKHLRKKKTLIILFYHSTMNVDCKVSLNNDKCADDLFVSYTASTYGI